MSGFYSKLSNGVRDFIANYKTAPNIVIMSNKTREDFRNEFYGKRSFNSGNEIMVTVHCGYKLNIIKSDDIPDGEFMLATNFKKQ